MVDFCKDALEAHDLELRAYEGAVLELVLAADPK